MTLPTLVLDIHDLDILVEEQLVLDKVINFVCRATYKNS